MVLVSAVCWISPGTQLSPEQGRAVLLQQSEHSLLLLYLLHHPQIATSQGVLNQLQRGIKKRCFVFFLFHFMFPFYPLLSIFFSLLLQPFPFLCFFLYASPCSPLFLHISILTFFHSFLRIVHTLSFCLHRCLCCLRLSGCLNLPVGKMNVLRAAGWRRWPGSLSRYWSSGLALLGNCKCCGINGGCTLVPIVDRLLAAAPCNLPPGL